ncbi:MAG: calcium-binding protein, partial [Desulfobacterales bacterium]|nr:calcium-binding protein [Desulfobacterales bacterium]
MIARTKTTLFNTFIPVLFLGFILLAGGLPARGDDSLCARVKIEISQELTLERQAFDARMTIHNGLSHLSLENVNVDVAFTDADGNSVIASSDPGNADALFFIRVDDMQNIDDVQGLGQVAPDASATIHWLIIPAPGAAAGRADGALYYVGAALSYTMGGEENFFEVTPDYIHVKPLPQLTLDYFLPLEVYGDDAFTPAIEPPVPFNFGLRVANNGVGPAHDLKLDSAQPNITENEQGLLVGFRILGGEVQGQPGLPSLMVDLGDIQPGAAAAARWIMTCSLSGKFESFSAGFSHSDELGGALTSLIENTNAHLLLRDVLVDLPGRDALRDFLARDGEVLRVYETENTDAEVSDLSASATLQPAGADGAAVRYTLSRPDHAGFSYIRLPDPTLGQKELTGALHGDNKAIRPENVWQSKSRDPDNQWLYYVNLFDVDAAGPATLIFEEASTGPRPPTLQFIPDRTGVEGAQLSFIVEASDPDGTTPVITISPLPAGASLTASGDGTAFFDWTPAEGQAGERELLATASDGEFTDEALFTLTIHSILDADGDGAPDAWEMAHFGTLDRDGSGDFDGDGISDLDEHRFGTDPLAADYAPGVPVILSPLDGARVETLTPTLTIANSQDPNGDEIVYQFEVHPYTGMVQNHAPPAAAAAAPETADATSWTPSEPLDDNRLYFWRVRASDGVGLSQWAWGGFFVDEANDPPGPFYISAPADGVEVATLTPTLSVTGSVDPDQEALVYTFEVYEDAAMNTPVFSGVGAAGDAGGASRAVDAPLEGAAWYYWRAVAEDPRGARAWTALASFFVNASNQGPGAPAIHSPAPGAEIAEAEVDLTAANAPDGDNDPLTYLFQIDEAPTFDGPGIRTSGPVSEGVDVTSWLVSGLVEDVPCFWRVKAGDGSAESPWAYGSFLFSAVNHAPGAPVLINPGDGAWVETAAPTLSTHPCVDPEGDALVYRFEVYADASMTELLVSGQADEPAWMVSPDLPNKRWSHVRVRAEDERGLAGPWTPPARFFVNDDGVDQPPSIAIVAPDKDLTTREQIIPIRWEDEDPDSNALISLYRDVDASGGNGVLIAGGIEEDPDGDADALAWDAGDVADGIYYLYAEISDAGTTVRAYSGFSLTIDRTPPAVHADPAGGEAPSPFSV